MRLDVFLRDLLALGEQQHRVDAKEARRVLVRQRVRRHSASDLVCERIQVLLPAAQRLSSPSRTYSEACYMA